MRSAFRFRLRLILAGVVFAALIIVIRLYFVQILHGEEYSLKADRQYVAAGNALFDRGSIYFTRKDGTLVSGATLASGFLVAVNPQTIKNPTETFASLKEHIPDLEEESFLKTAGNKNAVYVEIAHRLSEKEGEALATKRLSGVHILRERWVTYPGDMLAAGVLGIVARQAGDDALRGRTGLEAHYDQVLSRSSDALYKNFFAELFSNIGSVFRDPASAGEGDVITTLEPAVVTRLASDLEKVSTTYSSKESGGIIMDPKTGEILAIVSYPTYDANDLSSVSPSLLMNPLVEHVYEFGSIMKALTMASALDAGAVTPDTTYKDTGCMTLDTSTICNFDLKARGVVPMQAILSQSLNMGAAFLAGEIGSERFRNYFLNLGFGEKTGIDLPSETSGLIRNLESPRQIEYATAAFGQGIAVTPVEMIRALATLANGGKSVTPHLGKSVRLTSGVTRTLTFPEGQQVFSPEATREVSKMLTYVVDHDLSKGKVRIPSYSVAAKTGTAQLTDEKGGYYKDRYFHSFFGYFPAHEPRFIILLYTNDPKGVAYASETLTTTFIDLVHFLIEYYDIPPDREAAAV